MSDELEDQISYPRLLVSRIAEARLDTPVILLSGARQTGKSTLLQDLCGDQALRYVTLDDPDTFEAASSNPYGFIDAAQGTLMIDEVQRVPDLLLAIKRAVDKKRTPGRFLLTGSANVMLLPKISESLADRMEVLTLRPLAQRETNPNETSRDVISDFFEAAFHADALKKLSAVNREDLLSRLVGGGYPEALKRHKKGQKKGGQEARRNAWFESYLQTVLLRDIKDIAQIESATELPALLNTLALRTTGMLNIADIARTHGMPQTTIRRYLTLLETVYLIEPLEAWTHRKSQRAQKTPKYFLLDSGLYAHLLGISSKKPIRNVLGQVEIDGAMLETFVLSELRKLMSVSDLAVQILHYRTSTGLEVDFVLQDKAGNVVGVEVKASSHASKNDFKGLNHLREILGDKFKRGIVLHAGERAMQWDKEMMSVPLSVLWD